MGLTDVDIVIPWVNASDIAWQQEKNKFARLEGRPELVDDSDVRYRDWEIIKYLMRSIDFYMPWIRKVFFITWGHIPIWMDVKNKKLRIIKHSDYIPNEYLPTFSSHTIELNLHRIDDLAEQFVYFNDDLLVLQPLKETDFFINGQPRDYAVLTPIISSHRLSVQDTNLTNIEVINDHFNKTDVIKKNFWKWMSLRYGHHLFQTFCLMPWHRIPGLLTMHQCNAYLKSTFDEVWEKEFNLLDSTCRHKFRTRRDVNQWLIRYWQLASGTFKPIKPYGRYFGIKNNNDELFKVLKSSNCKTICVNDNGVDNIINFEKTKSELIACLEEVFPQKSSFEV